MSSKRTSIQFFALVGPIALLLLTSSATSPPENYEQICIAREGVTAEHEDFAADSELRAFKDVVFDWIRAHDSARPWSYEDLTRFLLPHCYSAEIQPGIPMDYEYYKDATGVITEICKSIATITVLPQNGKVRIQITVWRW